MHGSRVAAASGELPLRAVCTLRLCLLLLFCGLLLVFLRLLLASSRGGQPASQASVLGQGALRLLLRLGAAG